MTERLLTLILITILVSGGIGIILLQLNILKHCYSGQKKRKTISGEDKVLSLKVVKRKEMTDRHFSVCLQAINGEALDGFLSGQYLTLLAQTKPEQNSIQKRCYSLASWRQKPHFYELVIQREEYENVSSWLYRHLQEGSVINVLPPKGNFVFNSDQLQHAVLVAGGIGITPLRAMVHQFIFDSLSPVKTMSLFYAAKSVDEMWCIEEFLELAEQYSEFYFYPVPTQADKKWQGLTGRISVECVIQNIQPVETSPDNKINYHYYLCGSEEMINSLKEELIQKNVFKENIHFERFVIDGQKRVSDEIFSIKTGENKTILFQDQRNILEAMEQQGVELKSECRSGECGECKVKLCSGKIKQLIDIDIDLDKGDILACCCVPESDLSVEVYNYMVSI